MGGFETSMVAATPASKRQLCCHVQLSSTPGNVRIPRIAQHTEGRLKQVSIPNAWQSLKISLSQRHRFVRESVYENLIV